MATSHRDIPHNKVGEMTPEEIEMAKAFFKELCVIEFMLSTGDLSKLDALLVMAQYEETHPGAYALFERWDYFYGEH